MDNIDNTPENTAENSVSISTYEQEPITPQDALTEEATEGGSALPTPEGAQEQATAVATQQEATAGATQDIPNIEDLPPTPKLSPQDIKEIVESNAPSLASIETNFLELLESALNKSDNWKEQIYLCLQGVSRVLRAFLSVKHYQEESLSLFPKIQAQGHYIKAQIEYLSALVSSYNDYFDEFNRVMLGNNATLARRYALVLEQIQHTRGLIEQASQRAEDVLSFKGQVSLLLEKLESLEALKDELLQLNISAQTHIKQMQEISTEALKNIKENCLSVINKLEILEGQISQNVLNTSQRVISEIELLKHATQSTIDAQLALVEKRIEQEGIAAQEKIHAMDAYLSVTLKARDFAQALLKAFESIADSKSAEIVKLGKTQLESFKTLVLAKIQDFDTNAQAKLADYNANDSQKLQEYNDNALAKLEEHNTNAAQKLEDYNSNDAQKLQEFNDNYLAKLADLNANLANSLVSARLEVENFNGANMAKLEEFEQRAQEAIAQYNSNALNKLEEHNNNAAQKLKDFNDTDSQKLQEYNTNALAKLEEYNANAAQKLKDYNDNHDVKLANFNSTTEALTTQSTQSLTTLKETLLQAVLDGSMQERAQIAQLKELLERLQAKQSRFGADFQARIFTESSTFETPTQGLYYFIFVQGGTGADNSTQGGAPSSFGSLISAPGGAGGGQCSRAARGV